MSFRDDIEMVAAGYKIDEPAYAWVPPRLAIDAARKALEAAMAVCAKNQAFYRTLAVEVGSDTLDKYIGASHCEAHIGRLLDELK